jgi:hypothetical protein
MHDFHIRDSDIRVGYAFPTGPGLPHSGVLASQRGNETQDYRGFPPRSAPKYSRMVMLMPRILSMASSMFLGRILDA